MPQCILHSISVHPPPHTWTEKTCQWDKTSEFLKKTLLKFCCMCRHSRGHRMCVFCLSIWNGCVKPVLKPLGSCCSQTKQVCAYKEITETLYFAGKPGNYTQVVSWKPPELKWYLLLAKLEINVTARHGFAVICFATVWLELQNFRLNHPSDTHIAIKRHLNTDFCT